MLIDILSIVMIAVANAFDWATTSVALDVGAIEVNPLVKWLGLTRVKLGAFLVQSTASLWWGGLTGLLFALFILAIYILIGWDNLKVADKQVQFDQSGGSDVRKA